MLRLLSEWSTKPRLDTKASLLDDKVLSTAVVVATRTRPRRTLSARYDKHIGLAPDMDEEDTSKLPIGCQMI